MRVWAVAAAVMVMFGAAVSTDAADQTATVPGGARLRALSDDEVQALWENRPVRSATHRSYIFIDEDDIVEGNELPLFRVESSRYGALRQLERMADGDPGAAARIADLAPELARETEMSRRANAAFYSRRSAAARRDTPDHPDVVVGPLMSLFGRGR